MSVEEHGPVRLHSLCGLVAAVLMISGQPWCAIAEVPGRGMVLVFVEDLP